MFVCDHGMDHAGWHSYWVIQLRSGVSPLNSIIGGKSISSIAKGVLLSSSQTLLNFEIGQ